jgi:hypothetical protein
MQDPQGINHTKTYTAEGGGATSLLVPKLNMETGSISSPQGFSGFAEI